MTRSASNIRILSAAIACSTLVCACASQASIVASISLGDRTAGASWNVTLDGSTTVNTNQAGLFQWTGQTPNVPNFVNGVDSLGNPTQGGSNFISFCIEITQTIGSGTHTLELIDLKDAPKPGISGNPMDPAGANAIAKLWSNFLDDALAPLSGNFDPVKIGAFQLAVWKLVYDEGSTFDLSSGRLKASTSGSNTVGSIAQGWLNAVGALNASSPPFADGYVYALTKGPTVSFQDQLVGTIPPGAPVPEAMSLVIWGLFACVTSIVSARHRD